MALPAVVVDLSADVPRLLVLDADSVLLSDPFRAVWADSDLETGRGCFMVPRHTATCQSGKRCKVLSPGTDHFPERDLWQPEMRPEENLNTGFLPLGHISILYASSCPASANFVYEGE